MVVEVFAAFRETGPRVVGVYPCAGFDIGSGDRDGIAVLYDGFPAEDRLQRDLVTAGDLFLCGHCDRACGDGFTGVNRMQGDGNVVSGMDLNDIHFSSP